MFDFPYDKFPHLSTKLLDRSHNSDNSHARFQHFLPPTALELECPKTLEYSGAGPLNRHESVGRK